jgi:hypothetical protein
VRFGIAKAVIPIDSHGPPDGFFLVGGSNSARGLQNWQGSSSVAGPVAVTSRSGVRGFIALQASWLPNTQMDARRWPRVPF